MSGRWELHFDGLPPGPNDRMHHMARARSTRWWRTQAWAVAVNAGIPLHQRIRLSVVIHRRNLGVADEGNDRSRFKGVEDGLVDAGVVLDDRREFVTWGDVSEERGPSGFTLVIEALEPEPRPAAVAAGAEER